VSREPDEVSLLRQLACIKRAIGLWQPEYSRRVTAGLMTAAERDREIHELCAVYRTLQQLQASQETVSPQLRLLREA
jgi:hypothetical protein